MSFGSGTEGEGQSAIMPRLLIGVRRMERGFFAVAVHWDVSLWGLDGWVYGVQSFVSVYLEQSWFLWEPLFSSILMMVIKVGGLDGDTADSLKNCLANFIWRASSLRSFEKLYIYLGMTQDDE